MPASSNPFIIGLQGDPTTWALPPSGKTAFGVNQTGEFASLQSDGTITVLNLETVGYGTPQTNTSGTSTVAVVSPITTQAISITGGARAVPIALSTVGATAGDVIRLKLSMASVAGYVVSIYNGSPSGALLYDFTGDGTSQTGTLYAEFSFDGAEWDLDTAHLPGY